MRDHTKNILIALLFATTAGLVLFFVGYALGVGMAANYVVDRGLEYMRDQNITLLGVNEVYDKQRLLSLIKNYIVR